MNGPAWPEDVVAKWKANYKEKVFRGNDMEYVQ